jgi:vacuolar-type H+-ATPase subunit I/STV1
MFKDSADKLDYIKRVGSHATKPRPSGRIDEVPAWAAEPEQYYNSVRDQYRLLADQLVKTQNALVEINAKLKETLPFKDYEHLRLHKERLGARYGELQEQASHYRSLARAAGEKAWSMVFYHVAERLLTPEDFRALRMETDEIIGRHMYEVKTGEGDKSEQVHENRNAHESRRRRRARWRRHHGGSVTVWADNKPVKQQYLDEIKHVEREESD